jgi:hypothetical protein
MRRVSVRGLTDLFRLGTKRRLIRQLWVHDLVAARQATGTAGKVQIHASDDSSLVIPWEISTEALEALRQVDWNARGGHIIWSEERLLILLVRYKPKLHGDCCAAPGWTGDVDTSAKRLDSIDQADQTRAGA